MNLRVQEDHSALKIKKKILKQRDGDLKSENKYEWNFLAGKVQKELDVETDLCYRRGKV